MPPLPDYPHVLKVRTLFLVGADLNVSTTVHFTYSGTAPTDAVCTTIAGDIYTAAVADLVSLIGDENQLHGVQVQDLTSPTSGFGEHIADTLGGRTGNPLPASTCALQNFPIARRYRGGKPRVYWPFGTSADLLNPSSWTTGFVTDVETGTGDYFTGIAAVSEGGCTLTELVSISYYEGFTAVTNPITGRTRDVPTPRSAAIAPDVVLGIPLNQKPASQRRRIKA